MNEYYQLKIDCTSREVALLMKELIARNFNDDEYLGYSIFKHK